MRPEKRNPHQRRRGIVLVQVLVMLSLLVGFAAFTIDIGTLVRARAELQNAADAAALSAASAFSSDAMLEMKFDGSTEAQYRVLHEARRRAVEVAYRNYTLGSPTRIEPEDIVIGWFDLTSATASIDTSVSFDKKNAVKVTVRRYKGGVNGSVPYFFAPIFGRLYGETSATAVAAFDDRFAGVDVDPDGIDLLPIIVADSAFDGTPEDAGGGDHGGGDSHSDRHRHDRRDWDRGRHGDRRRGGRGGGRGRGGGGGQTYYRDLYRYNENDKAVRSHADGIEEVQILPDEEAPGNYGWLGIGQGRHGNFGLAAQIENGVSDRDLESELGDADLSFVDDFGNPVTYRFRDVPGDDDLLVNGLAKRVGDVVGIFTQSGAVEGGHHARYSACNIRFVRIMSCTSRSHGSDGGLWVQPVTYQGNDVIVNPDVPSSPGNAGRVVLVQ